MYHWLDNKKNCKSFDELVKQDGIEIATRIHNDRRNWDKQYPERFLEYPEPEIRPEKEEKIYLKQDKKKLEREEKASRVERYATQVANGEPLLYLRGTGK